MASVVARTLMAIGATAALAVGSAHAANVYWSVGINAPVAPGVAVGTVISNGVPVAPVVAPPVYLPAPIYTPAPVYAPSPVVYAPSPVVYAPAPVVYAPRVVYGPPVWVGGRWVHHPVHRPYPVVWHPGHGHRGPPLPVPRMPGREIRY